MGCCPLISIFLCLGTALGDSPTNTPAYVFGTDQLASEAPPGSLYHWTRSSGQRSVAVSGDTVFVVWATGYGAFLSRSVDGAQSFGDPVSVDDAGRGYYPAVALGPNGIVCVAWEDWRDDVGWNNRDIYFDRSLDGGCTFGEDIRVDDTGDATIDQREPTLAVDPASGNIYVAWCDERHPDYTGLIYFSRSLDGGISFEPDIPVGPYGPGEFNSEPALAADPKGTVYVAWVWFVGRIVVGRSLDQGASFGDFTTVGTLPGRYPSLSAGPDGVVYVSSSYYSPPCNQILLNRSLDAGQSFEPEVYIDDCWGISSVASDADRVYVVWDSDTAHDIRFAASVNHGLSFSEPITINDVSHHSPSAPSVAAGPNHETYVAWSDERHGDEVADVYVDVGYPSGSSSVLHLGELGYDESLNASLSLQTSPNPTSGRTTVSFDIPPQVRGRRLTLRAFTPQGRLVRTLLDESAMPGVNFKVWDGTDSTGKVLRSGIYFLRLSIGDEHCTTSVILLR